MSSKVFYPYCYAEQALEVDSLEVDLDGEEGRGNEFVDRENQSVVLTSLGSNWSTLTVRVLVSDPNSELQSVLPPEEKEQIIQLWIVARNKYTRLRRAVSLKRVGDSWEGKLSLDKGELARTTELECFATLNCDVKPEDGYAWKVGERIADAPGWRLYTDIVPAMPGGALNSEWVRFEDSENHELTQRSDCVWYLDLADEESPRLLLNEGVPNLRQTLEVEQKTGKSARIRDSLIHSILQSVINELAVFSLSKADGAAMEELPEWQQRLLISLARTDAAASEEIVVTRWITSWKGGGEAGRVLAEISTAVQRHLKLSHSCEHLAKTVEREVLND